MTNCCDECGSIGRCKDGCSFDSHTPTPDEYPPDEQPAERKDEQ